MKSKSKKLSPNRISHKRRFLRCFLLTTIVAILLTMTVLADDADTINIIKEFDMPQNNVVSYVCRWIGWALLCGLSYLVNGIESVIYNVNSTIGNFFANAKIQNLNDTLLAILFLLLLLVVLFVGLLFIIQPQQQIAPIVTNVVIGIVVLITVPYMISSLYSVTNSAIGIIGRGQQAGMGTQILLDNVTDVLRYDANNFSTTDLGDRKSWYAENSSDRITDIDITEMIAADQTSHSEVFGQKVEIDASGTEVLADINTGSFFWQEIPLLSERYYRWKVDWLVCFVSLIISAIALFLSSIRMAVALYELSIHGMMTEVMALLDVYTHQRMKKCLQLLVTTFASFFGFFLLMQIYLIGMNAISSSSADLFVKIVCMVALGWMVIDGPSIFEKVIGQDLGVRNAARTMVGIRAAGATAGAIAGKGGNLIRKGKNGLMGRRTFGGGREGGLRGRIVGDKNRDASNQVTHTGGLVNQARSFQGMIERRKKHRADQASDESASAHAEKTSDLSQDSATPMNTEKNDKEAVSSASHVPKYRPSDSSRDGQQANSQPEKRNTSKPGSPFAPVGGSSYSPSGQRAEGAASSKVVRDTLFPDSGQEKNPSSTSHKQKQNSSDSSNIVRDTLMPDSSAAPEKAAPQSRADTPHEPKLNPSGSSDVVLDTLVPGSDPASGTTAPQPLADAPHEQKLKSSGSADVVYDKLTPGSAPASEKTAPQPMAEDAPHEPKLSPSGSTGVVYDNLNPNDPPVSSNESYSGGTVQPAAAPQGPVSQPSSTAGQPHVSKIQSAGPAAAPESGVIPGNLSPAKAPSSSGAAMPRYRSGGRVSSAGSSQIPHTPKYQPSYQPKGGSQPVSGSGSGSSYRPTYNAPHMPKYRPNGSVSSGSSSYQPVSSSSAVSKVPPQGGASAPGGTSYQPVSSPSAVSKAPSQGGTSVSGGTSYRPVSGTSYVPKVQQQTVSSIQPPVSNTPYTPKVPPEASPTVHIDNLWTEPAAPEISQPVEVPHAINVPDTPHPAVPTENPKKENKMNPKE